MKQIIITWESIDSINNRYHITAEWMEAEDWAEVWFCLSWALRDYLNDIRRIIKEKWVTKEDKIIYNEHIKEVVNSLIE